jgi:hypothetical protein
MKQGVQAVLSRVVECPSSRESPVNRSQRSVVLVALAIAALMLVFPPWETFGGHYLGHAVFTSPPGDVAARPEGQGWALPRPEPIARVSISLLAVQFAVLWVAAGAAVLLFSHPRGEGGAPRP